MGFLRDLGGAALGAAVNGARNWAQEANEYYEKGMDMSDERLRKAFKTARENPSNKARLAGYSTAMQERGLA